MKDAYYFSHDSNARNDTKILSMRCDYGLEGYGMYWMIIETLRDESNYILKLDKSTYKALAMQMHSKVDTIEKFIDDCINEYELFNSDGDYFWAESLLRRMGKLEDIRNKRKAAADKRWNKGKDKNDMQMHNKSNASAKQTDAKESKVKESKVKKSKYKEYVLLTPEEYKKLLEKLSTNERDEYIERLNDYIGQSGKKYKSHYHTILNWHRRDVKDAAGTNKSNGNSKEEGKSLAERAGVISL